MSPVRRLAVCGVLAAVYVAAGRLGLQLAFVNQSASAVWPPTGIAIAAGLLLGPGVWPAVFVGALLVNLTTSGAVVASVAIAVGNTLEAVAAVWIVRRWCGGAAAFDTTPTIVFYVGAAALAAMIASSFGLAALTAGGLLGGAPAGMTWLTWWTGDLSSALLLTPAIVTWTRRWTGAWPWRRCLEVIGLVTILAGISYLMWGPTPVGTRNYPLMFTTLPVLLWAALRFGPRGATATVLLTATIATAGTLQGYGPFARNTPNEALLLLQAYLSVKMIVMLSLAAEVAGRRTAEREMRDLNADLAHRVEVRSEELRRLHDRLIEAQQVAHIGSWEWDVAGNALWWSDEMYRLYGLEPGTPVSYETYLSMIHPDDRAFVQETVGRSARTGEPFAFEHRILRRDGSVRVLNGMGRVVLGADGSPVRMLGVGHDVTDLKRAEEERLQLVREQAGRREAEEASRMKDHFLATLSHELRTPLNTVVGWAHMLRAQGSDEGLRQRAVEAIYRNSIVQAQLVSDILDVARIRSGTLRIDARPVELAEVVNAALDTLQPMIEAKQIAVRQAIRPGVTVTGDPQRLQQVFWNVLSNAAKFVPPGGEITLHVGDEKEQVTVVIEDTGPGIPAEFLPFVFEQFRQADASITREHGGLGLGLSIAQTLVQMHAGAITAGNRREGGAVFTITLPTAADLMVEPRELKAES